MLESQGALLLACHGGKLLEVRWFADDVEREDAFFGPPDPVSERCRSELEQTFETATADIEDAQEGARTTTRCWRCIRSTSRRAPGDVSGERPGALDMVDRAKYDAWARRKGVTRDDAMRDYVALVKTLKERDTAKA